MDVNSIADGLNQLSQEIQRLSISDWAEFTRAIKIFFSIGQVCFSLIFGICLAISVLLYVAEAMIFLKAHRKSWSVVIPLYSSYVMFDISIGKGFLGVIYSLLAFSLLFVPVINAILGINCVFYTMVIGCVNFILRVFMNLQLSKKFNKGFGFAIGLILLPFIFYPILGFGKAEYNFANQDNIDMTSETNKQNN